MSGDSSFWIGSPEVVLENVHQQAPSHLIRNRLIDAQLLQNKLLRDYYSFTNMG